jgi:hypothetical protein
MIGIFFCGFVLIFFKFEKVDTYFNPLRFSLRILSKLCGLSLRPFWPPSSWSGQKCGATELCLPLRAVQIPEVLSLTCYHIADLKCWSVGSHCVPQWLRRLSLWEPYLAWDQVMRLCPVLAFTLGGLILGSKTKTCSYFLLFSPRKWYFSSMLWCCVRGGWCGQCENIFLFFSMHIFSLLCFTLQLKQIMSFSFYKLYFILIIHMTKTHTFN